MVAKKKSTTSTKRKTTRARTQSRSLAADGSYRSFKIDADYPAFWEARISRQTFYWSILLLVIIVLQLIIIANNVNASLTLDSLHFS